MSNSIPNSSLYQFLARVEFNKNGKTWVDTADGEYGNKDGVVTYNEFVNFLNVNWDNESYGALNNDIVKRFWSSIDSDTKGDIVTDKATRVKDLNALNKDEMKALEDDLEKYKVLNTLIEEVKADCPAGLKYTNWCQYVKEALTTAMEAYIDNGGDVNNLDTYLRGELPRIEAEVTAKVQADYEIENLKKGILKDLDKYGYDIENDPTLAEKIDMYINGETVTVTINGKDEYVSIKNPDGSYKSVEDVQADIVKIIKSHLEEIGIGSSAPGNTDPTVDTTPGIGAIAALKKELAEALTQLIKNNFDGTLEDSYLMLVDDYINKKGINANNYQEIKDLLANGGLEEDFKSVMKAELEEAGKTAKSLNALNTFINGQGQTLIKDLMPLLNTKFGEAVLAIVLDSPEYKTILNNAKNDIDQFKDDKGGIDANKFAEYLSAKISTVLGDILQNGYDLDNPTVDNLNQAQESAGKVAEGIEDPDARTVQYAKLVEGYLSDISGISDAHEEAVNKIFTQGTDYESIMKQFDSLNDIKKAVKELKEILKNVIDVNNLDTTNANWASTDAPSSAFVGKTYNFSVSLNGVTNNGNGFSDFTYAIRNGEGATIDANGNITFAPSSPGKKSITVYAMHNGKSIGKEFTIDIEVKKQKTDIENSTILNQNASGILEFNGDIKDGRLAKGLENTKNIAISTITSFINGLTSKLHEEGYDDEVVGKAATTTINFYKAAIEQMTDICDGLNKKGKQGNLSSFTYIDGNGKEQTVDGATYVQTNRGDSKKKYDKLNETSNIGLRLFEKTGTEKFSIEFEKSKVIAKFKEFFRAML